MWLTELDYMYECDINRKEGVKMGDMNIDEWCWRMEEHKRKGHKIIKYPITEP